MSRVAGRPGVRGGERELGKLRTVDDAQLQRNVSVRRAKKLRPVTFAPGGSCHRVAPMSDGRARFNLRVASISPVTRRRTDAGKHE